MSDDEKEAISIALDTAYGRVMNSDGSHYWESNDSGLTDEQLDNLVERLFS